MVFTLGQWSCRGLSESVIARDEGPWELRQATWNLAAPYLEFVVGWRRRGDVGLTEMVLYRSISRRNASYPASLGGARNTPEATAWRTRHPGAANAAVTGTWRRRPARPVTEAE